AAPRGRPAPARAGARREGARPPAHRRAAADGGPGRARLRPHHAPVRRGRHDAARGLERAPRAPPGPEQPRPGPRRFLPRRRQPRPRAGLAGTGGRAARALPERRAHSASSSLRPRPDRRRRPVTLPFPIPMLARMSLMNAFPLRVPRLAALALALVVAPLAGCGGSDEPAETVAE